MRIFLINALVFTSCGPVVGITEINPTPVDGGAMTGETKATPGVVAKSLATAASAAESAAVLIDAMT